MKPGIQECFFNIYRERERERERHPFPTKLLTRTQN
jgi:hypothetical protein